MTEGKTDSVNSSLIQEVAKISESRGVMIRTRDQIKELVESPLVEACEHFWDLNIRTLESTANSNNIGNMGGIVLDYESLSDENKKIAQEIGQIQENYGENRERIVSLNLPITEKTTVQEIQEKFNAIAHQFKKQDATWVPSFTLSDLKDLFDVPQDEVYEPKDFVDQGYYYDSQGEKFYLSEEHYQKTKEK